MDAKQRIIVIGDGPTCTGFKLAGIEDVYPVEIEQAEAKIEALLSNEKVGIMIVNERLLEKLNWILKKKIDRIAKPVVIAVPDKEGAIQQEDSLNNMIKKAHGFDVMK